MDVMAVSTMELPSPLDEKTIIRLLVSHASSSGGRTWDEEESKARG